MGVCKVTVKLPEAGSKEIMAESVSQTSILKVGCISCGELDFSFSGGGAEVEPITYIHLDPNDDYEQYLFDAGNLHLPVAFNKIRVQTQEQVNNISLT